MSEIQDEAYSEAMDEIARLKALTARTAEEHRRLHNSWVAMYDELRAVRERNAELSRRLQETETLNSPDSL